MNQIKERKVYSIHDWANCTTDKHIFSRPVHIGYVTEDMLTASDNKSNSTEVIRKIIKNVASVDTLDNVSTIHRLPNISLSRDKVKIWCDANKAKVVRDKDTADIIIYSENTVEKTLVTSWYQNFSLLEEFIPEIVNLHQTLKFSNESNATEMLSWLNDLEDDCIISTGSQYRGWYGSHKAKFEDTYNDWWQAVKSSQKLGSLKNLYSHIDVKKWDVFKCLMKDNCMLDSKANELMSADSVVFDDEIFMNIKNMIKGGNKEDIILAMTTIANCNIDKSKTYLAMLFFHYNDNYFKPSSFYNSVLFKSVRTVFQKYSDLTYARSQANPYSRLAHYLIQDNALTNAAERHILDMVFDTVVTRATGIGESIFNIDRSALTLNK